MAWKKTLVKNDSSVQHVMKVIDEAALQVALVVDDDGKLLGMVTDGDIRRGILKGLSVTSSIQMIMNQHPTYAHPEDNQETLFDLMRQKKIHHIPLVDSCMRVVGIETLDQLGFSQDKDNLVVIMAGGRGERLKPLTDQCPKPLLPIANKPILEHLISHFTQYGFHKFVMSVNYKAEMLKEYFYSGKILNAEIDFVTEGESLGTAGSLSLISLINDKPVIVINGDILTRVNLHHLLAYHQAGCVSATMCVKEFSFKVPYGVVQLDHHEIVNIDEKPMQKCFINAGIYVLEPPAFSLIPKNTKFDMTHLFELLMASGKPTAAFPITEYWQDIGQIHDYNQACDEYSGGT